MHPAFHLLAFLLALWPGVRLLKQEGGGRRPWPVVAALLGAAATHFCALMALSARTTPSADFWRRMILLLQPLFLLPVASIGLANAPRRRPRGAKAAIGLSYALGFLLAAALLPAPSHAGDPAVANVAEPHGPQQLFAGACLAALAVTVVTALAGASAPERSSTARVASSLVVGGLGLVGVTVLFQFLPGPSPQLLGWFCLLAGGGLVGWALWRIHAPPRRPSGREGWPRLLRRALSLASYCVVSSALLCWLIGQRFSGSPLLIAIAITSLGVGTLEVVRSRISSGPMGSPARPSLDPWQMMETMPWTLTEQDLPHLMEAALERLCRSLGASRAFVALRGEGGGGLRVQAVANTASLRVGDVIDIPLMPQLSLPIGSRQAILAERVALLLPLGSESGGHGLLGVGPRAVRPFTPSEVQHLASAAGLLTLAIENVHLRRQLTGIPGDPPFGSPSLPGRPLAPPPQPGGPAQVTVRSLGEFTILLDHRGPPEPAWGGRSSGHRHAKALLAYLVANRERTVCRDELIEVIWGESADLLALENRLDRTMSALRRALEPGLCTGSRSTYILTDTGGYRLNPSLSWRVDAEEFSRLVHEAERLAQSGDDGAALDRYLQAEALYRGDYMAHCPFIDRSHRITTRRESLRRQYLEALLSIADLHRRRGDPAMQIRYLEKAAQEDEFNERVYQLLIAAYCERHRHAEARQLCRRHRAELAAAELPCSEACFPENGQTGHEGN